MKSLRIKIFFSLAYLGGLLIAPTLGLESHHCPAHLEPAGHHSDCASCSLDCLPESPFAHSFEGSVFSERESWFAPVETLSLEEFRSPAPIRVFQKAVIARIDGFSLTAANRAAARAPPRV